MNGYDQQMNETMATTNGMVSLMNKTMTSSMHQRAQSSNNTNSFLLPSKINPFASSTLTSTEHVASMMNAHMDRNSKKWQLLQLEARLRKLQTEEALAQRKTQEARRQEEFIQNMKMSKAQRNKEKEDYLHHLKLQEEATRDRINENRYRQRSMINQKWSNVVHSN